MAKSKINVEIKGSFNKTIAKLDSLNSEGYDDILKKYGEIGVERLKEATPKDTSLTSECWSYKIITTRYGKTLQFNNSNTTEEGTPIVILLQYGHGTKSGVYVEGIDFINPALKKVFDDLISEITYAIIF